MANAQQQDVSEFWTFLVQACYRVEKRSYCTLTGENEDVIDGTLMQYTTSYWKQCGLKYHSHTLCRVCKVIRVSYAYMHLLQLPLPAGNSLHLKQCLELHSQAELLTSGNDKCDGNEGCGRTGCREKRHVIDTWPQVLCILLLRWIPTNIRGVYMKENRAVEVPVKLPQSPGGPSQTYVLRAAIIHKGTAGGGIMLLCFMTFPRVFGDLLTMSRCMP